jgi:hypothetical protein
MRQPTRCFHSFFDRTSAAIGTQALRPLTNDVRTSGPGLDRPRDHRPSKRLARLHRRPPRRRNTISTAGRALEATSRYIGLSAQRARRRHQLRRIPSKRKYYVGGRNINSNRLGLRLDATNPLTPVLNPPSSRFQVCRVSSKACGSALRHARAWRAGAPWVVVLKSYAFRTRRIDPYADRAGVHPRCSLQTQNGATYMGRSLPIPCARTRAR